MDGGKPPSPRAAMALAKSREYQDAADAPSTLRAYAGDLAHYKAWCENHGFMPMPATPEIVGAYLAAAGEGYAVPTLRRRVAAIARACGVAGQPLDTKHPAIRKTLRGIGRKHGTPARRSAALTTTEIKKLCKACRPDLSGVRDRALFLIGFAGAMRRSELVGLDVSHVTWTTSGLKLLIERSKTDASGEGAEIAIPRGRSEETCPVASLKSWLETAKIKAGPLFRKVNVPEVAVIAALTHIHSRPWLEQMVARASRVDVHAGPYEKQRALVFHPDDPLFAQFRHRMETDQGTLARRPKPGSGQGTLPLWLLDQLEPGGPGITPLRSNALAMRFGTLQPGPNLAMQRPELQAAQSELLEAPSATERRLRVRLGEMVAAQAVEDEEGRAGLRSGLVGPGLYHRYNAILKRVCGNKSRAEMTLAELDAAVGWLERNRLSEQMHLLDDDPRYAWTARKRGEWKPPAGRVKRSASARSSGKPLTPDPKRPTKRNETARS